MSYASSLQVFCHRQPHRLVLLEQGHELVVLDNFDNSSPEALRRVQELARSNQLTLVEGDVRDPSAVDQAFSTAGLVDGVIHFAGLKAVGESVSNPLLYWDVNVNGSRVLAAAMECHGCRTLVFSSTSTAYGEPDTFPLREDADGTRSSLCPDQSGRNKCWQHSAARAPAGGLPALLQSRGAHPSGRIGEDQLGFPTTCSPSSLRGSDVENACAFSARTTPHQMALASVITCT